MKYTLIKGLYHVVVQSPDADSIKFQALNPTLWQQIETENRAIFERRMAEEQGVVTLRFEGIDALETHYTPPNLSLPNDLKDVNNPALLAPKPKGYKQLPTIGGQTTDKMLELMGITQVKWRASGVSRYITEAHIGDVVVKEKLQDNIPGFIITGDIEMNGRPLAWVFTGKTSAPDGLSMTSDDLVAGVEASINYQLLKRGLAYPFYFMSLTGKLRSKLNSAVLEAQAAAQAGQANGTSSTNIWQLDSTVQGLHITRLNLITDERAIYPYLFRKIIRHQFRKQMEVYWAALRANAVSMTPPDSVNLDGFFKDGNPYVFIISDQDFVRLADVLEIKGNVLKMKKSPHDLVFLSA